MEIKTVALYYEYFTFKENEDGQTVTLTDYNSSLSDSTDITIPSTVDLVDGVWQDGNTYTVTAIANGTSSTGVFYNSGITSITFPETLENIGNYAFYRCSGLTSISLPSSLKAIGSYAFQNCSGLTGELNLGECTSLTSIGRYAFRYCSGLTGELNLGGCTSLTSIGRYAFEGCTALESVVFPEGSTGWYVTTSSIATSGTDVDVTDPSVNADNLVGTYRHYYWRRSA